MKPSNIPQLEIIDAILQDIEETDNTLKFLKERLDEVVRGLDSVISDRDTLIELANYLYWMVPEVRTEPLAEAVTGQPKVHLLKKYISNITAGICCDRCKKEIPFASRNKLHETIREIKKRTKRQSFWPEGYLIVCETCRDEIYAARHISYQQQEDLQNKRLKELRYMPYKDYLKSSEWQERRIRHLKSAGFRCQVCNNGGIRLDVHHRTYERRGEEFFKDLIVLCENCHELFHREGKLAQ
jgi:hypothetical protein